MNLDPRAIEKALLRSYAGIILATATGKLVFANEGFCELAGLHREKLLAMKLEDLVSSPGRDLLADVGGAATRVHVQGEIRYQDGAAVPVEITRNMVEVEGVQYLALFCRDLSEIPAADVANQADPELYRTLFNQSNDAIFIHDLDGHFIRMNQKAREYFRLPDGDPCRWSVKDIHPESELENSRRHFQQFIEQGSIRFEILFQRQDGSVFPGEVSSSLIHIGGKPYVQGIVRDLSRRKDLEKQYRSLFELSPVPLWEEDFSAIKSLVDGWRKEGVRDLREYFKTHPEAPSLCVERVKILDMNQAALKMHGATNKDELLGGLDRIFTQESYTVFQQEILALAEGSKQISLEGRVRHLDGTPIDVIISAFIMPGSEQNWDHALVSLVDITSLKRLQHNLQDAQKLAKLGSWELILSSNDLWWSPEVYRIFELEPETFGPSYDAFLNTIHPDDRLAVDKAYSRHLEENTPYDIIHRLLFLEADGTERLKYVHEKCQTERDDEGKALRSLGTVQDVTAKVLADQEKAKQQHKMEHVQRLESLGVLAGGIAHDFNNLLTAIMGHSSMGRSELNSPVKIEEHLEAIEKTSLHAADLCRQMLAYSGKGQFQVQPLNLSELVESMVRLLEVSLSKRVVVRYDLAQNLPPIKADMTQIQQIIMNLVINANEAIAERSGSIMIGTGLIQVDQDYLDTLYLHDDNLSQGPYVFLEISDTGCGMDEATQNRIFEPFFTTKFTGRGLGMSAVQGIVRGHEGAIKVYSEVNKGTTFKVLFPALDLPLESPSPDHMATQAQKPGTGLILVVDDEETVRNIAVLVLQRAGYQTITACDGYDAIDKLKAHASDVVCVLLDMTMPKMGGEQAYTELVRIKPELRVILSSGYNEQTATQKLSGKGLAGFIQKPYTPKALLAKVSEILA